MDVGLNECATQHLDLLKLTPPLLYSRISNEFYQVLGAMGAAINSPILT